jgi:hypothetical protein
MRRSVKKFTIKNRQLQAFLGMVFSETKKNYIEITLFIENSLVFNTIFYRYP